MEPRQLLSAAPIQIGAVYFEDQNGIGTDQSGDLFEITFSGGAPGTRLTELSIDTDKFGGGLDPIDVFYDTATGGLGTSGASKLAIDPTRTSDVGLLSASVEDGGSLLVMTFDSFDSGDRLVFSIDVDEVGLEDEPSPLVEGAEFAYSHLGATFDADHFYTASGTDVFRNAYDAKRILSGLDLPPDNYNAAPSKEDQTAGAFFSVTQEPLPITIAGTVFEDFDLDNSQDPGDPGIEGVELRLQQLVDGNYVNLDPDRTVTTDADGHYQFDDVLPGTYRIIESQPNGYHSVGATAGTVDGLTRGKVTGMNVIAEVSLLGGDDSVDNDFAEARPVSLSGYVYHDANDNGVMDPGESGIGGATVRVQYLPPQGVLPQPITLTTLSDGSWSATELRAGEYEVTEVTPAGYLDGKDAAGTVGGTAHNPGDRIDNIHLQSGQNGQQYNFGELMYGSISGRVHLDLDGNTFYNPGEPLLEDVTIQLLDASGTVIDTTQTNVHGEYVFAKLEPGVYGVHEVQPPEYNDGDDHVGSASGMLSGTDSIVAIPLGSGIDAVRYDFSERPLSSISGRVHLDLDGNGLYDAGEPLLKDVTIQLFDATGQIVETAQTDSLGEYSFIDLFPGRYTVREIQPTEYNDGKDHAGSVGGQLVAPDDIVDVDLPVATDAVRYDFSERPLSSLSGRVHLDLDGNSLYDAGEPLLKDVTIYLLDVAGQIIDTTQTDGLGEYTFTDLRPGLYGVREIQPAGYNDGMDRVGSVGGRLAAPDDILDIDLPVATDAVRYDFSERLLSSISGRVHLDVNADGLYEAGEPLLKDVTIYLLDAAGQIIDTTQTDASGEYAFTDLLAGQYGVREVQPAEYNDGKDHVGSVGGRLEAPDDIVDIDLPAATDAVRYDFTELPRSSISGRVHVDLDGDGVYDGGAEKVLSGVTIELLDADGNVLETRQTDKQGEYLFDELLPGVYAVHEVQPSGYLDGPDHVGSVGGKLAAPDSIVAIDLAPSTDAVRYDFAEVLPSSISGYVYADDNNNGIFDKGEEGLGGVQIALLDAKGMPEGRTTTTDATGFYQFTWLMPGVYGVAEPTQPDGFFDGTDAAGSAGGKAQNPGDEILAATLAGGTHAIEYNFGELRPASLRGRVHAELNGDCIPDPGEPLLAGVTIYLLDATGERIRTTTTDVNGEYVFTNLEPGVVYGVEEIQPEGYLQGRTHAGSAGGKVDGDVISQVVLDPNEHAVEYNFCEMVPASISGYVFQDGPAIEHGPFDERPDPATVRDGKHTSDDTPIAGVKLTLGDTFGMPVLDEHGQPITTTTDSNGYYEFTGLKPGLYTVFEVQPNGFVDSIDTAGTLGGLAVNPHEQIDVMVLNTLAVDPGTDAILRINLNMGEQALENNFSEVVYRKLPFDIPPERRDPDPTPEKPPINIPEPSLPSPPMYFAPEIIIQPLFGGAGGPTGYTWHLSVVNAGQPRRDRIGVDPTTDPSSPFYGANLADSLWLIADEDGRLVRKARYGTPGAIPVAGDFNGDGTDEFGIFLDGHWLIDLNGNGVWDEEDLWIELGSGTDQPVVGDWDGDGKADIGVFGPAWPGDRRAIDAEPGLPDAANYTVNHFKNLPPEPEQATDGMRTMKRGEESKLRSDLIDHVFEYGQEGDRAVAGDFNGDGITSIGVFRDGTWYLDLDGNGRWSKADVEVQFGREGDHPVVGDFNGDGTDEIGVYRGGTWYLDSNANRRLDAHDRVFQLGTQKDLPVVGDFDGDGTDQAAVYQDEAPPEATTE